VRTGERNREGRGGERKGNRTNSIYLLGSFDTLNAFFVVMHTVL